MDFSRSLVARYCSSNSRLRRDEALDGPTSQAEEAQLLGRLGVDGEAIGIVCVALR